MHTESQTRRAHRSVCEGWQGIVLIAATYVYFLIFAQFGFLKRLAELGMGETALPLIMAGMAIGGISISLLAPRSTRWNCPSCRLQTGFIGCALTALWSLLPLNLFTSIGVAFAIGLSLGLLTVTLVANLPIWIGAHRPLIKIGLGTGIGYFLCNLPPLFAATPPVIALSAAGCCLFALIVANRSPQYYLQPPSADHPRPRSAPFALVLGWFIALVWLDSAAFYIIQNSPDLKAGTWQGNLHLWRAGVFHFAAALVSAWLLARRGVAMTLAFALAVLSVACLLLFDPFRVPLAAVLYPIGVSLYSVALVAYPSFLMPAASQAVRARSAGYLYSLAGWIGSAMGIGMARNLHHVPVVFVTAAGALFVLPWLWSAVAGGCFDRSMKLQALAVVLVLGAAFVITLVVPPRSRSFAGTVTLTPVERGRRVYIAEGCINCHSQYVRPNTVDVAMWGPATDVETIRREKPPLIGNRRQGPDLSQVGARRSPLWLRIHFMNPRDVSYDSVMPRYDYLFRDSRGDDLIAYLASLDSPGHWSSATTSWQPSSVAHFEATGMNGAELFAEHCTTCHTSDGTARNKWSASFHRLPPDLAHDAFQHTSADASPEQLSTEIARITRFGLQGTDMPGHEYLPDEQIAAIADYVAGQRKAAQK
jgi:cytochrome c oxidase cbb3-type subunit 2